MKNKILLFLKGGLMGICDLIPGISGGTIAFITGIYTRLINAVKGFSLKLIWDIFMYRIDKKEKRLNNLKQDIKKLDLGFLFVLFLGIGLAILVGSRIIKYLLTNYIVYTLSFFIGLILVSSIIIFGEIQKKKDRKNLLFGILGLIFGICFVFLIPVNINPSLFYVFFGGFLAVSAMFLPGISGAFILLIMGLYEFILNVLHDIPGNISYFLVFILGAVFGAFSISRLVSFLFKKDKCKTLYFLLGLVIGALGVPLKRIFNNMSFKLVEISFMIVFLFLGMLIVVLMMWYKEVYEKKLQKIEDVVEDVVDKVVE